MRWTSAIAALLLLVPSAARPEDAAAAPAAPPKIEIPTDGATLYGDYCAKCHGPDGSGTKLGHQRGKKMPDFSSAAWQTKTKDQAIRNIIEMGGPKALGNMKKMQFKVAYEPQILAIIAYVRSLGAAPAAAPADPAAASAEAAPTAGGQ